MEVFLVLTVIGPDRPGIVERLSEIIAAHESNWLESRMALLAGQFAGILRTSVSEQRVAALISALEGLKDESLRVVVERSTEDEAVTTATMQPFVMELTGNDRPGIVRDISRVLAARGVNVEELASECVAAPMIGGMLFRATAQLRAPAAVSADELRRALEELANDVMVELTPAESTGG